MMIIPKYFKKGDKLGVTACSCGVLDKINEYEKSIKVFNSNGFSIVETNNVRTSGVVSSDKITRARELESLFLDDEVVGVAIARGGDFLSDMLSEVDFSILKEHPKWMMGSSDPTSLLYIMTTKYNIATIYSPCNMTGFDKDGLDVTYVNYLEFLKGNFVKQVKSDVTYVGDMEVSNNWLNFNGDIDEEGILIGGCIEVLKDIIGTKFDNTLSFIDMYKEEGIIWYFDIFNMSTESLYNTLIQFRNAGWFKYTNTILIGKVAYPSTFTNMSYEDVIRKSLYDMKVVYRFDVGHVKPSMTMINGFKVRIISNKDEHSLEYIN